MKEASRRTQGRQSLARHAQFDQVSPEVGELDERAFDDAFAQDPDATLAMLADLTGATDEKLRALARRLAGQLFVDVANRGPVRQRGIGRLATLPYRPDGGDLDMDSSMEAIGLARAAREAVGSEDLRITGWVKPGTALCLLVDRSGSMGGAPLATAALAAAAVAHRARDYSVVAFAANAIVAKSQGSDKAVERVVTDVLTLRGFGTTDVALALRTATAQLQHSRAGRKITLLLSDCRSTTEGDVHAAAAGVDELVILAPADDRADADALGLSVGARVVPVEGPMQLPAALANALGD